MRPTAAFRAAYRRQQRTDAIAAAITAGFVVTRALGDQVRRADVYRAVGAALGEAPEAHELQNEVMRACRDMGVVLIRPKNVRLFRGMRPR